VIDSARAYERGTPVRASGSAGLAINVPLNHVFLHSLLGRQLGHLKGMEHACSDGKPTLRARSRNRFAPLWRSRQGALGPPHIRGAQLRPAERM